MSVVSATQRKLLPNGAWAEIERIDGKSASQRYLLSEKLPSVISGEAAAHDVMFDDGGLTQAIEKIIKAVEDDKIQAYFMIVGWANCRRHFAGGAIEFPTVLTEWNGTEFVHYPAVHGEDTFVSFDISALLKQRTVSHLYPKGVGAGTIFMQERVRFATDPSLSLSPYGLISRGRIAEFSAHSTAMVKVLTNLGASLGTEQDGTILQLDHLPSEFARGLNVPVEIQGLQIPNLLGSADIIPNAFITSWASEDGRERIVASFTEGITTFTGDPVFRVQFTSNGFLPSPENLKDVLAGLVIAGYDRTQKLGWTPPYNGSDSDFNAFTTMRIHALREPRIVAALAEIGAVPRLLGGHPMLPVITNHKNMPKGVVDFKIQESEPFKVLPLKPWLNLERLTHLPVHSSVPAHALVA